MYNREEKQNYGLIQLKICDFLVIQVSFILAYFLRHGLTMEAYTIYIEMLLAISILALFVIQTGFSYQNIIKREYFTEVIESIKLSTAMLLLPILYMFMTQVSFSFSRLTFLYFWIIDSLFLFLSRCFIKHSIRVKLSKKENSLSLVVIGGIDDVEKCVHKISEDIYLNYKIIGTVIVDSKKTVDEIPSIDDFHEFVIANPVDEVMIFYGNDEKTRELQRIFGEMGLTIHNVVYEMSTYRNTTTEEISDYTVITASPSIVSLKQLAAKRLLDIVVGLVGALVTCILTLIIGPIIYFSDRGNIFFTQTRIGKNGHKFKLYKFRSMYRNAEEKKKELESQNEMNGLMFKMENDPRIIKGIGSFIRKTSLDEFPQFFNVLKGDMSVVGTRPPTEEEYEKYDFHHMKRLSIKPGITGLWQISGRNDIKDFEKVVELDTKYIDEWSLKLDLKIIFKTVLVVFTGKGAK